MCTLVIFSYTCMHTISSNTWCAPLVQLYTLTFSHVHHMHIHHSFTRAGSPFYHMCTFMVHAFKLTMFTYTLIHTICSIVHAHHYHILMRAPHSLTRSCWGNPGGAGTLEWGGFGEGEVSSQATWGQGGRDRTTQREGFQVSERGSERESRGTSKGSKRWVCAISILSICICVYNKCLNVINNLNCV